MLCSTGTLLFFSSPNGLGSQVSDRAQSVHDGWWPLFAGSPSVYTRWMPPASQPVEHRAASWELAVYTHTITITGGGKLSTTASPMALRYTHLLARVEADAFTI
jgi:hypothetical protein